MKLQTQITIKPQANQIDYASRVVLLGSCFAENIGEKLSHFKFQNTINLFGIIFNPVAIEKLLKRAINEQSFTEDDIFLYNGQWHCFEVHSSLSNANKDLFLSRLNVALNHFRTSLLQASHVVFTFGTAWVYREIQNDIVVANCHKIPQQKFHKELLSPDDVSDVLLSIESLIKTVNPTCALINTVSPVRHIKDGIIENSRSKAHLLAGIHEIISEEKNNHYFPSFEIMMDELRDYRFYTKDMIHPSETAIEIIWERFNNAWISSETFVVQKKIASIIQGLAHKPFNENSEAHQKFLKNLEQKISEVQKELPHSNF